MDGPGGGPPGGLRHFLRDDDLSPAEQAEVLDEAENRLHAQKALLAWLLERAGR
jgi:ornithine carbamoyltransferase